MKLVNIKILALLVISYSIALVAMTPLSWLMPYVEPTLAAQGVRVSNVEGSIWHGKGLISERTIGSVNVDWDVNVISLVLFKVPINIHFSNGAMDLAGKIVLSPMSIAVQNVSGHVDEVAFKPLYQSYRADIQGRLQLEAVSAKMSWSRVLADASGDLSWSGGPISIPVGRSTQTFKVPTMLGVISSDESQWQVQVSSSTGQTYIFASLTREGLGTLSLKRELATDMNIPVPGSGSSMFDISQQVF